MKQTTCEESEIVRLRAEIEAEAIAAHAGLSGLAAVARHATITARMERIGAHHERLTGLIGDEAAAQMLCAIMEQCAPPQPPT